MTLKERDALCSKFFMYCQNILAVKGSDYNPSGLAFDEVKRTAKDLGITPHQVLMVYINKHYSALKTFVSKGNLKSEDIDSRLKDLASYMALMHCLIIDLQPDKEEQTK